MKCLETTDGPGDPTKTRDGSGDNGAVRGIEGRHIDVEGRRIGPITRRTDYIHDSTISDATTGSRIVACRDAKSSH